MTVRAAGAVVFRSDGGGHAVCLVHRPRYDDWSLPKGKLDDGESDEDAALREVFEEAGIRGTIVSQERASTGYRDRRDREKVVTYFLMRCEEQDFQPNEEVDEIAWLAQDAAIERLTYQHDEAVVRSLLDALDNINPTI